MIKACENCGENFEAVGNARNCLACRKSNHTKSEVKKMTIKKICPVCKKEFDVPDNRTIYCSPECRKMAQLLRSAEQLYQKTAFESEWAAWKRDFVAKRSAQRE